MTAMAYKATRPETITGYNAERLEAEKEFDAKVSEFRKTVNGRELQGIRFYDGGFAVQGFALERASEELPAGWRRDGSSMRAVPAKRTPEGKAIAEQLRGLRLKGHSIPGAPEAFDTGTDPKSGTGYRVFPRLRQVGGDHFMTLSKVPCKEDLARIDAEVWKPVKLSEYHAALESAGEQP